ncbi:MAG TPA: translation initiation factor IF-2 [Xanthobacteraceae bacterium]|nr:translation initiation factor IF-2 [Xanthobacteraceae bacterium]
MSETKNPGEKTLSVHSTKTLTLKRGVEQGVVRQSFSHGRTKPVVVEKVKRRTLGEKTDAPAAPTAERVAAGVRRPAPRAEAAPAATGSTPHQAAPAAPPRSSGVVLRTLTEEERAARAHALADARQREAEERRIAEEEARRRNEREARERAEREAAEARKREEEERRRQEEEAKKKAEQEAKKRFGEEDVSTAKSGRPVSSAITARVALEPDDEETKRPTRRGPGAGPAKPAPAPKPSRGGAEKRRGRLTLVTALDADEERERSVASFRRRVQRMAGHRQAENKEKIAREVTIPETITIQELANRMAERAVDVVRLLMKQGHMAKSTDLIDADTAQLIAEEMGHTVRRVAESDVEEGLFGTPDEPDTLQPRPPVVTIMGHVDHGKTSLLDALRETDVAGGEHGGITQHIGAYQVRLKDGQRVTFLDTPGHAAFSAMRARGAQVTDIVVLVVAADDGVMPQTVEAIQHARASGAPIIVAINKIDKPDANPTRVLTDLLQHEIVTEAHGGDTLAVEVSALKKTGLDKLVETILLQAEVMDLKANPDRPAEATVIESKLDKGRGTVATVLVQKGTLKRGDIVVVGAQVGRVRAITNERGQQLQSAGPSEPVEIMGLEGVPEPGDVLNVVENENRAREVANYRARTKKQKTTGGRSTGTSLESMMARFKDSSAKELPLLVKADVQGSAEAIVGSLEKLAHEEVRARIVLSGVGAINESDVQLAKGSGAPIIGFNVRASKEARDLAEREGVEIRYYNIIYDLIDDIKGVMSGMLAPLTRETFLGNAEVLEVFTISKVGKVAGCRVTEGVVRKGAKVRILRDNVVIQEMGTLTTLKRFKDEVNEVVSGQECGMSFGQFQDIKQGDVIECFNLEVVQRSL